jgi:hypothetical protein
MGSGLERSIPYRTLRAGELAGVPSGQELARALGFAALPEEAVWGSLPFGGPAPLWFYLLREAELKAEGARFGELGGALFADTVTAALARDAESYVFAGEEDDPALRVTTVGDLVAAVVASLRRKTRRGSRPPS